MAKVLKGTVVSDKMNKTVVVRVERYVKHPKFKKYYRIHNKFKAHDEENKYKTGDKVLIQESRPISKKKTWAVIGQA